MNKYARYLNWCLNFAVVLGIGGAAYILYKRPSSSTQSFQSICAQNAQKNRFKIQSEISLNRKYLADKALVQQRIFGSIERQLRYAISTSTYSFKDAMIALDLNGSVVTTMNSSVVQNLSLPIKLSTYHDLPDSEFAHYLNLESKVGITEKVRIPYTVEVEAISCGPGNHLPTEIPLPIDPWMATFTPTRTSMNHECYRKEHETDNIPSKAWFYWLPHRSPRCQFSDQVVMAKLEQAGVSAANQSPIDLDPYVKAGMKFGMLFSYDSSRYLPNQEQFDRIKKTLLGLRDISDPEKARQEIQPFKDVDVGIQTFLVSAWYVMRYFKLDIGEVSQGNKSVHVQFKSSDQLSFDLILTHTDPKDPNESLNSFLEKFLEEKNLITYLGHSNFGYGFVTEGLQKISETKGSIGHQLVILLSCHSYTYFHFPQKSDQRKFIYLAGELLDPEAKVIESFLYEATKALKGHGALTTQELARALKSRVLVISNE